MGQYRRLATLLSLRASLICATVLAAACLRKPARYTPVWEQCSVQHHPDIQVSVHDVMEISVKPANRLIVFWLKKTSRLVSINDRTLQRSSRVSWMALATDNLAV